MRIQTITYTVDLSNSLLWQYNKATTLEGLILSKQNWYDKNQTEFWENWYADVFNLATANDFGLSVWSILLGLPLFLAPDPDAGKPIWGFDDSFFANFDNGNFANDNRAIVLTTEQQRLVLQLRYFQLANRGDAPTVNAFLKQLFEPLGQVYFVDTLKMQINYIFTFAPEPQLLKAIQVYDLLPRPAGVGIKYIDLTRPTFGFDDDFFMNFDNGTFIEDNNA